ncbi:SGNH/GDSL hydrolase family protein [Arthrobacter mobilis]|uniref:GDSL family lipase n=1 Tax=Arthrobacter mobilis TaxID=2724944 RepID=A0A7X6K6X9_9MICC|nr:SGNH/GDSL hydrolase family protein [Arthrobacter mobilis]NKX55883.1 GDSL family lipase [Arthrobacter mobilis]
MDPTPFTRGLAFAAKEHVGSRVPPECTERFACDTASAAQVPAGVRLEFSGNAGAVDIDATTGTMHPLAAPVPEQYFSVWLSGRLHTRIPAAPGARQKLHIDLPPHGRNKPVTIHLPEGYRPVLHSIEPIGGTIFPLPPRQRWVAYGDSITQGWTTSDPGRAWTAVAAREANLDVINLGFAGAARGELPAASFVSTVPTDVISLAWGTNCWSQIPMDRSYITELMRFFLTVIRSGHPETPIVVLSPLVRPQAESIPNSAGATLEDLRQGIEAAVATFATTENDGRIHLVPGRELISSSHLVDGIHPGDQGHALIGQAMAAALTSAIRSGYGVETAPRVR